MHRRRQLEFAVLLAFSVLFWASPLTRTFRLALSNEAYTHIILIVPLSLALIYLESRTSRPAIQPSRLGGLFLLAAALALGGFARWSDLLASDVQLTVSVLAVVLWWIACVVFCFGLSYFHTFLFPVCLLFWLVPWPDSLLNQVILALQNGSAVATRWLLLLARVPVTQSGVVLSLPGGFNIEVARECSSIRSSTLLVVMTMVMAYLFLRSNWRRLIVILVAIPLAVAKNALRIFVIVMLAMRVDPEYLNGDLHHRGGIVFLLVALAIVSAILWLLARGETVGENK